MHGVFGAPPNRGRTAVSNGRLELPVGQTRFAHAVLWSLHGLAGNAFDVYRPFSRYSPAGFTVAAGFSGGFCAATGFRSPNFHKTTSFPGIQASWGATAVFSVGRMHQAAFGNGSGNCGSVGGANGSAQPGRSIAGGGPRSGAAISVAIRRAPHSGQRVGWGLPIRSR